MATVLDVPLSGRKTSSPAAGIGLPPKDTGSPDRTFQKGGETMVSTIFFALSGVLIAWLVVHLIIHPWGPGLVRHFLLCPERKLRARVTFNCKEESYGSVKAVEVKACSLFPNTPPTCGKRCMG